MKNKFILSAIALFCALGCSSKSDAQCGYVGVRWGGYWGGGYCPPPVYVPPPVYYAPMPYYNPYVPCPPVPYYPVYRPYCW